MPHEPDCQHDVRGLGIGGSVAEPRMVDAQIPVHGGASELEAEGCIQPPAGAAAPAADQVSLMDMGAAEVANRLRAVDVNTLTPIEAMNLIFALKQKL